MSGRGPDAAAPFCTSGRDVSAGRRAIEELYQMRRLTAFGEHLKERLEDTGPAQSPEPLPYAVPVAKFIGQCSPGNTVDREIVNRLQEFTVVTPSLSPARLHRVEHFKRDQPIPLRHPPSAWPAP